MDIEVIYEFLEGFLPTPRSRKTQYRAVGDIMTVPLLEVPMDELRLAYRVKNNTEIYAYKDQLYRMIRTGFDNELGWKIFYHKDNPLEFLQNICLNDTALFAPSSRADTQEKMKARIHAYLDRFLVADGVLFIKINRPVYVVETSGQPYTMGSGTYLRFAFPEEGRVFPATEPEAAIKRTQEIAASRGDMALGTDDMPHIEVFPGAGMPVPASGFDAEAHKQYLQKLCRYSKAAVAAMEPVCAGMCRFAAKNPKDLNIFCNQCPALQTMLDLTASLSAAETCIYDIADAVERSTPNSYVSSTVKRWENSRKDVTVK